MLASPTGNPFAACAALFNARMPAYLSVCEYVKTTFALGTAPADSTRIFSTLAHLGWTHHHSTQSLPSFLTGLETEKHKGRERVGGEDCSFTFWSWHSFNCNFC